MMLQEGAPHSTRFRGKTVVLLGFLLGLCIAALLSLPSGRDTDEPVIDMAVSPSTQKVAPKPPKALMASLKDHGRKVAAVALGGLMALAPVDGALAARSGGRVGGRAGFAAKATRPAPPQMQAAPRTNIYVAPSLSLGGGYGMGYGGGYGYGYSPFGGGMSTGSFLGLSLFETILREQQRQAYLQQQLRTQEQLGRDQAMIQQLRSQVKEQDAKVEGLKTQQTGGDADRVKQLEKQLMEQQKQLDALNAEKAKR